VGVNPWRYDYIIQYQEEKRNSNADALSCLLLPTALQEVPRPEEVVHLMEHLDTSTVANSQIRSWTLTAQNTVQSERLGAIRVARPREG